MNNPQTEKSSPGIKTAAGITGFIAAVLTALSSFIPEVESSETQQQIEQLKDYSIPFIASGISAAIILLWSFLDLNPIRFKAKKRITKKAKEIQRQLDGKPSPERKAYLEKNSTKLTTH